MCPDNQNDLNCPAVSHTGAPANQHRRGFIKWCIGLMTTISAFVVAFPIFTFIRLPKRLGGGGPIEVLLADLNEDLALYFDRQGVQIVLIYTNKTPQVFDAACTHLGCLVAWDQNKHIFHCPCHGAVFDDQGAPISGPVSVPLKKIEFEIKPDKIVIV